MKQSHKYIHSVISIAVMVACSAPAAQAASPAAIECPPISFLSDNLAQNPDFEVPDPSVPIGTQFCWQNGDPDFPPSAADGWSMHTSNARATVCSQLVPSHNSALNGARILKFTAGGNEGGVYQNVALDPAKSYMFSIWVYVNKGQVAIQSNGTTGGPVAWTTKHGQWEELRVCTNSLFSTNSLVVYNEDAAGGVFFVDRVELKEILARE